MRASWWTLAAKVRSKFNLIPFNPFPESGFKRSPPERIRRFAEVLQRAGLTVTTRKTRGDDIDAACGQLAGRGAGPHAPQPRPEGSAGVKRARSLLLALLAGCAAGSRPSSTPGPSSARSAIRRNRAKLRTELASLYFGSGNLGVALEELRAAVAADSNYAPAHGMYGLVYMELRDNARAEESFERALRLSPNDADINHNYGWFLCQTSREEKSIEYFLTRAAQPALRHAVALLFGGGHVHAAS